MGDLAVRHPLRLEATNKTCPRRLQSGPPFGIPIASPEGRQSSGFEPPLVAADGSVRAPERPRHVALIGPPLLDEAHHRVGLGHAIPDGVLRHGDAGSNHDAMPVSRAHQTTIVDNMRVG